MTGRNLKIRRSLNRDLNREKSASDYRQEKAPQLREKKNAPAQRKEPPGSQEEKTPQLTVIENRKLRHFYICLYPLFISVVYIRPDKAVFFATLLTVFNVLT